jgi:hypothetical protein
MQTVSIKHRTALLPTPEEHGLLSVNAKDGPTLSGPNRVSWIDITVTSINSAYRVQEWGVSEKETHSDHNLIIFNILPSRTNIIRQTVDTTRKFATKVGKWNLFKQEVQQTNEKWKPSSNIPM